MSAPDPSGGHDDLSPSEFVKKIQELGAKRDTEDAERFASLERDILKGREERMARRAERARSLSPDKHSTPPPPDNVKGTTAASVEVSKMAEDKSGSSPRPLSRSGTLSWQQRPKSSGGRRPLSMLAAENAARSPRATPDPANEEDPELSRTQIAESLASKDPGWFRQTPDRGVGSAAYRRSQEDSLDTGAGAGAGLGRLRMPGMLSRESTADTERVSSPPPESARSISPSRASSIRMSTTSSRYSNTTADSDVGSSRMRSPPPSLMDPPKLAPSGSDRISPLAGRPPSPTKGMGGFVESAMLKRADSVNKRWSSQTPPGLSRQNSTASNRNSYTGGFAGVSGSTNTMRTDRPPSTLNPINSREAGSRPGSSHSNATVTRARDDQTLDTDRDGFIKPALPSHSRTKSAASLHLLAENSGDQSQPSSPTKRWSPTKATWLESALTKTEDKPKVLPAPPAQPSWMAEINKVKQHKSNVSISEPPKLAIPDLVDRKNSPIDRSAEPSPSFVKPKSPPNVEAKPSPIVKAKSPPPEPAAKPSSLAKDLSEPPLHSKSPSPVASPPAKSTWEAKKPATSPGKIDYRSNLKSQQIANDSNSNSEPEFKNALGKLKRTQTKNFVAPDPLKDNILRGKAGLNITGGPALRVRVDELKESLVMQKEAMKVKAATEPKRPIEKRDLDTPPPEALRKVLHRSQSSKDSIGSTKAPPATTPEAIARMKSLKEKSKPGPPQKLMSPPPSGLSSSPGQSPPLPEGSSSALARHLSAESATSKPSAVMPEKVDETRAPPKPNPIGLPGMTKPGLSGKLADRFNPGLASILARGSPAPGKIGTTGGSSTSTTEDTAPSSGERLDHKTKGRARGPKRRAPTKQADESSSAKPLSPTTKTFSPPLKAVVSPSPAPLFSKAKVSTPQKTSPRSLSSSVGSFSNVPLVKAKDILPSSPQGSTFPSSDPSPPQSSLTPTKPKPLAPAKSPLLTEKRPVRSDEPENVSPEPAQGALQGQTFTGRAPLHEQETASQNKVADATRSLAQTRPSSSPAPAFRSRPIHEDETSSSPSVIKPSYKRPDVFTPPSSVLKESPKEFETSTSSVSVKNATALWGRQASVPSPLTPGRPKSPVKLPTRKDEEKAMQDAGLMPPPEKPKGLGIGISTPTAGQASSHSKIYDRSPGKPPLSPPMSPGKLGNPDENRSISMARRGNAPAVQVPKMDGARSRPTSTSLKAPPESPIPHTTEANRLFTEFFDDRPVVTPESDDIDTVAILESYPLTSDKVQTLSKQLQMISGDGNLVAVPVHQEHILFDDSMYVCTHVFRSNGGTQTTEVYLWAGSRVAPAAVEDAQLFARRAAKTSGGKILVLEQGKETPRFFQALGGILTTLRGNHSRSSSGIPESFMLCGRKHMGHISFDEVDFSINSLCSGFPYLISSDSRLHLWKGKGCGAEELGCARLIAMDLGTTPDIIEISDGEENDSFLNLFPPSAGQPDKTLPRSADHWRLKATNDKYRCRLFRVEQQHGKSSTLQVSNFFSNLTRRTSWSSLSAPRTPPTHDEQPKTPTTPKPMGSPLGQPTSTRIIEIAPFTQGDVDTASIYVLDAFFEVYILIGPLARSQSHAFATALLFAQDYGILAASLEDRPFVPVSTVVLEGVPRDMKPCFRQWTDEAYGFGRTEALMAGKPKRGASLRCVGLAAALAATRA